MCEIFPSNMTLECYFSPLHICVFASCRLAAKHVVISRNTIWWLQVQRHRVHVAYVLSWSPGEISKALCQKEMHESLVCKKCLILVLICEVLETWGPEVYEPHWGITWDPRTICLFGLNHDVMKRTIRKVSITMQKWKFIMEQWKYNSCKVQWKQVTHPLTLNNNFNKGSLSSLAP